MVWDETWGDQPRKQTDAGSVVTDIGGGDPAWQQPAETPSQPDNAVNTPFTQPTSTASSTAPSTTTSTTTTPPSGSTASKPQTPLGNEWWNQGKPQDQWTTMPPAEWKPDPLKPSGQPTAETSQPASWTMDGMGFSTANGSRDPAVLRPIFEKIYDLAYAGSGRDKGQFVNDFLTYVAKSAKGFEDYWVQRALGLGAGGADIATSGPYAGRDTSEKPSAQTPDTSGIYNAGDGFVNRDRGFVANGGTTQVQPTNSPYQPITPDQYSDPATQDLLNFVGQRAQDLTNYQTPQAIIDLVGKLTQAMDKTQNSSRYADTQSRIDSVTQMLDKMRTEYQTPQQFTDYLKTLGEKIASTQNSPEYAQAQQTIKGILAQVTGDPYTATQGAALRAEHLSQLQDSRTRGLEQMRQTLASRGIPLDSGIAIHAERQIEQEYQRNKAIIERGLTIDAMNRADANRSVALNASQAGLGIENARSQQILSYAKAAADAMREQDQVKKDYLTSAAQAALQASGLGLDTENANQNQILTLMKTIADTVQGEQTNQQSYLDKALTMYSLPVSIADQRYQDALAASNGTQANPSTLLSTLGTLSAQNAQVEAANKATTQNMWNNILQTVGKIDWSKFFGQPAAGKG